MVLALSTLDYAYSALGFATSVGPLGPFKWELASPGDGLPTADIAAAVDDNGADAYLVSGWIWRPGAELGRGAGSWLLWASKETLRWPLICAR